MILLDVNVLVAAFRGDADGHERVRTWLENLLGSDRPVAVPAAAIVGFIRIVTHPNVFSPPSRLESASVFIDAILDSDGAVLAEVNERHWLALRDLLVSADARGNLVPDAHMAALAIQHGATLATRDRGFARFPGLSWVDPLSADA